MVSVSVSKKIDIEKVSDSVSKSSGIGKVLVSVLEKYWYQYWKKIISKKVSETNDIKKSIGFSIEKFWFRIWFRSDFGFRPTLICI